MSMRIAIYGSGRAATHLAHAIAQSPSLELAALCARDEAKARHLAEALGARALAPEEWEEAGVHVALLAVKDSAIAQVAQSIPVGSYTLAHLSGASSLDGSHPRRRVFRRLQKSTPKASVWSRR